MNEKRPWQDIVAEKRAERNQRIAKHRDASYSTALPFEAKDNEKYEDQLLNALSTGAVTATTVIQAYIAKAIAAHDATNCFTEILFDPALEQAQLLDAHLAQHGEPMGPLHGIPVTLKDQFDVRGYDSTLGYVGRSFNPAVDDAAIVKMLKSLGAVILAKTNLPQSIMWCETENPLFGLTTNPLNKDYTPGGSSGGESAVLACGGSLLGWGTDIGGSIRIPAHMMGLYGFKPSSARLPYRSVPVSTQGQEHIPSSIGPLSRSLSLLHHTMKSLLLKPSSGPPWTLDPRCVPLPWNESLFNDILLLGSSQRRPLKLALIADDGVVRPHPPISRVLRSAVAKWRDAGHSVVDWTDDEGLRRMHRSCVEVADLFYTSDGGQDIKRDVEAGGGEPYLPHVAGLVGRAEERGAMSVLEYWGLNERKWRLREEWLDRWNDEEKGRDVDAIIMPVMPHVSVPHRRCKWVGYTKVWNVLDYPALVIPAGEVEEGDVALSENGGEGGYVARNEIDAHNWKIWEERKAEMSHLRLPVGLQIVGRRLDEERVLAVGKILDQILHGTIE